MPDTRYCFLRVPGIFFFCLSLLLFGCGPTYTYPANTVPKSIEDICKNEYKLDVKARVVGKTVGAVTYVDTIISEKGQVSKEIHEDLGKVMQVVTRVVLSSDLPVDFCTVIMRDRKQGDELVITRYLDDIRRANADAMGVEESISRTVFGHSRYALQALERDAFVLKEIRLEDFIAEQIAQRIRFSFSAPPKSEEEVQDSQQQPFVLVDGHFEDKSGERALRFSAVALKAEDPQETILNIFKLVNSVLQGYRFDQFDKIEIQDYLNRQKLVLDKQTILDYQNKKINDQEILSKFLVQSQSIQEAFKMFGFNVPKDAPNPEDVPATAASDTVH